VPARFDTDHKAVTIETYKLHAWQEIPIVELRGCAFLPASATAMTTLSLVDRSLAIPTPVG
jgi:hypothetical protein